AIVVDKDLRVIEDGIVEGRRAALNAMKYVKATLSANLGNVMSVLAASVLLPFLPMMPVQLLVQNLCYDGTQLALPLHRSDAGQLGWPGPWSTRDVLGFVASFALLGSVFDLATYGLLVYLLPAGAGYRQALFQTAWFVVGLLGEILAVLVIRTGRIP